jgi:hypothetical protein
MARHNREGQGTDQHGHTYSVNYQPDWLRQVKVTRTLETGRQSTKTLFRNPMPRREAAPGDKVRVRVSSPEQGVDVEVGIGDPRLRVRKVQVHYAVPRPGGGEDEVVLTLENGLLPPEEG